MSFKSVNELKECLEAHQIDLSLWGKDAARTAMDLYIEVALGECEIIEEQDRIMRLVQLVVAVIPKTADNLLFLLIQEQTLPDGRARHRSELPGGKKRHSESPQEAMTRELKEELQWKLVPSMLTQLGTDETEKSATSYPGLITKYRKSFFLTPPAHKLPTTPFTRKSQEGGSHSFQWVPIDQLPVPPRILPGS